MISVSLYLIAAQGLFAVAMWLILLAVGARIRNWCRLPVTGALRWSVDLTMGAGAASTILLAASLAGIVGRLPLLAIVVGLGCVGRWRVRRPVVPLVAAATGGLLFLPVALGPPFFYDAMVYHLGLPWQALIEGGWHGHPENLFSTFPPLAQLLSLPALALGLDRVPAIMHWLAWVTAATAVFGLARRFAAPTRLAGLTTATVLVLPITPMVPGFPAAEAWLLVGLIPAIALAVGPCRGGSAALAGLLTGVATAARLQGLPWSLLVVLLVGVQCRGRLRTLGITVGCWLVGASPWWAKNLVLLGDPTAPLFWHREGMETLWRDSHSMLKRGASPVEALAAIPRLLAPEVLWLLPLLVVGLLAVITRRRTLILAATVGLGLAAWPATGGLPRFLAPTVCLLLALAATAGGKTRISRLAAGIAIGWCLVVGVARGVGWLERIHVSRLITMDRAAAAGLISPNDPMGVFAKAGILAADARVLFVAEPRSLGFPRPYITPSQHDVQPLRSLVENAATVGEISAELRARDMTHVLVNWNELSRLGDAYPVAPWQTPAGQRRWNEFLRDLGPPVVHDSGVQIYQLPP